MPHRKLVLVAGTVGCVRVSGHGLATWAGSSSGPLQRCIGQAGAEDGWNECSEPYCNINLSE